MKKYTTKNRINKVEATDDILTGRGGIILFERYIASIKIYSLLEESFGFLRKSNKGVAIWNVFKQIFCFFFDGSSRSITHFDILKKDEGYTAAIENEEKQMISSHAVKRVFKAFPVFCGNKFRRILKKIFMWRLQLKQPKIIILTVDTMVMNNDEALKREGVHPTYKKVKGFHPLQIIWEGKIVDAIFRGGSRHGNGGHTVVNMIMDMVKLIRESYSEDVIIVIRIDSGFFDEINFEAFDNLNIIFIATGKIYEWTKEKVQEAVQQTGWKHYDNGHQKWEYVEFSYKCKGWNRAWHAIYTRPVYDGQQMLLEFARPDNVIITNIGVNPKVLQYCTEEQKILLSSTQEIIASHHQRGADELPHRGLKDFGFEQLPFKRFSANTAFYYCMLISFFLFETYKEDVLSEVIPITSYATTVRRTALDFAAKIIKTAHEIILKVPKIIFTILKIDTLWYLCNTAPVLLL